MCVSIDIDIDKGILHIAFEGGGGGGGLFSMVFH